MNNGKMTAVSILVAITAVAVMVASILFSRNTLLSYTVNVSSTPGEKGSQLSYGSQPSLSNPDFFGKVKQSFIDEKATFIEADLSSMVIRVYEKGAVTIEAPIVTKGKEGSWWETPAGLYKISNKEKEHFSSMGHVWMPWSMNFQGNFFIHGRTYYPDGTLTSTQYTGGCIRLSTEDAERIYKSISVGTPLLVFEHSFSSDDFKYSEPLQNIRSSSFLAADLLNNHVFAYREPTKKVPIASLTKLMTALVTTEYINLDNIATVPKEAIVYTSKPRLKEGEKYSVYQLLFPLLMESSNEAAETIARYYGREAFVRRMNDKAAAIGMTNTVFADPSGAAAGNVSTAEDLFMLAKYIYNNRSFVFSITSGKLKNSAYGENSFTDVSNLNDFVDQPYFLGGKNGKTTAAQETNISVFNVPINGEKRPIVYIVLDSPEEKVDASILINYVSPKIK